MNQRPEALKMSTPEALRAFMEKLQGNFTDWYFSDSEALNTKIETARRRLEELGNEYDTLFAKLCVYDNPDLVNNDERDTGKLSTYQRRLAVLDADGKRWADQLEKATDPDEKAKLQSALDALQIEYDEVETNIKRFTPVAEKLLDSYNKVVAAYRDAEVNFVMLRDHGPDILEAIQGMDLAYEHEKDANKLIAKKSVNAKAILGALDDKFGEMAAKTTSAAKRNAPAPVSAAEQLRKAEKPANRWIKK